MKVTIFGLGYVGCVSLGCLAQNGFEVVGVDISTAKVDLVNRGLATIIEKDIDQIIKQQHKRGRIFATQDYLKAVGQSDVSIICVGTPSTEKGNLNFDYIYASAKQIGEAIASKRDFHTIVIRSTVMPGTNRRVAEIIAEQSGKVVNRDFAVVSNPEFLREGSAVQDYYNPPLTVIGTESDRGYAVVSSLYEKVSGPIERVDVRVAEIIKYVNNSYHALKVTFANEIGNISKRLGIDSHEVMRIFCMDKQLNISTYYFKPGFAYGGSCLPKDLKALKTLSEEFDLESPVLKSIEISNQNHIKVAYDLIRSKGCERIGILGVAFKDGTDDLRYSPVLQIIEKLSNDGFSVKAYDKYVNEAMLIGANKSYLEENLPYLREIMTDSEDSLLDWADLIVINKKDLAYATLPLSYSKKLFVDLARIGASGSVPNYEGITW